MTHSISDYGLTAKELEEKYEDSAHPQYWRLDQDDPTLPYWDWVVLRLRQEEDQLCRDNPYNQWMYE